MAAGGNQLMGTSLTSFDYNSTMVHPHWIKFFENGQLPASHWVHISTSVYITIIGVAGTVGNALLFWAFIRCSFLRSSSNMLVVNLAISDFSVSVAELIFMSPSSFNERWLFGESGCTFYAMWVGLCGIASIGTMAAIAMDRYWSITKYSYWRLSYFHVFALILVVWMFALATVIPPVFGWSTYILESFQTTCSWDFLSRTPKNIYFNMYLFGLGYVLPLTIIACCYTSVIGHIMRHRRMLRLSNVTNVSGKSPQPLINSSQEAKGETITFESDHRGSAVPPPPEFHLRATIVCLVIVCLFCLAWTPYSIVALIGLFGDQTLLTPFFTFLPVLCAKSSCIWNPIVYAFTNCKFRRALRCFPRHDSRPPCNPPSLGTSRKRPHCRPMIPGPASYSHSSSHSGSSNGISATVRRMEADVQKSMAFKEMAQRYRTSKDRNEKGYHVEFVKVPKELLNEEQIQILKKAHLLPST